MKYCKIIIIAILASAPVLSLAQSENTSKWTDYIGSHYTRDNGSSWSNTVRTHHFGIDHNALSDLDKSQIEQLTSYRKNADMLLIIGGLGTGRNEQQVSSYMNSIASDKGEAWKAAVSKRVNEFASIPGKGKIYIQVGNEISSQKMSENLHKWSGDGLPGTFFDNSMIPWYVEYYLAPTVSGINRSGVQDVSIVLGSATVYSNNSAEKWLFDLLNYKVEGTFSPELRGMYVYELVDVVSIHYLMMSDIWKNRLDSIHDTFIKSGKIAGVWSTEEIGIKAAERGDGAMSSLRITARYLTWAEENYLNPSQVRWIFYGGNDGPEGNKAHDAMSTMLSFTGESRLTLTEVRNDETYPFSVANNPSKRLVIAWSPDNDETNVINLKVGSWADDMSQVSAVAYKFGNGVKTAGSVSVSRNNQTMSLTLNEFSLDSENTVLITLSNPNVNDDMELEFSSSSALPEEHDKDTTATSQVSQELKTSTETKKSSNNKVTVLLYTGLIITTVLLLGIIGTLLIRNKSINK